LVTLSRAEVLAIDEMTDGRVPSLNAQDPTSWEVFALRCGMEALAAVREVRLGELVSGAKSDGSPVTMFERNLEDRLRGLADRADPSVTFLGEESGGKLAPRGLSVAVDPVDGTWAFLSALSTCATSIGVFLDGRPVVGVVANPATGELSHARVDGEARLLQLAVEGWGRESTRLPISERRDAPLLLDLHPSTGIAPVLDRAIRSWQERQVGNVRMSGGSPARCIADAARGHYTYLNLWGGTSLAYDVAAACVIMRAAGGDVVDVDGSPIDVLSHSGPFVAGVSARHRSLALGLLSR
jgi:fructose-1,6-bisphosphatase/inositol monophosphatase family enzyme